MRLPLWSNRQHQQANRMQQTEVALTPDHADAMTGASN
ncbi:hypothetical protein RR11_406 [Ruegeria sp. R11]|nr:hypothetical protein RR11_406 [Ruegeria sp. R11]